jgi:hypothetical protein
MRHRLLILGWIALLGVMPAARGQPAPTAPVDLPAESALAQDQANLDLKHSLDPRHADLLQRFQAWNTQAQTYNSQYASRDLDPDSPEYAAGQAMLSHLSSDLSSYNDDNAAFATDVAKLVLRPVDQAQVAAQAERDWAVQHARISKSMNALAKKLGWSQKKRDRLARALHDMFFDGDPNSTVARVNQAWADIMAHGDDADLVNEASQGGGLGFPGAGTQSFNDCTIFAVANAAGLPYGVVAAHATSLIQEGDWRSADERANPQAVIEKDGLKAEEIIMLAESVGQAEVVPHTDFAKTLTEGRTVIVGVNLPGEGADPDRHEAVLTKTFQHNGETWYVMMDSNQDPQQRHFLSANELNTILVNGVAYRPEPKTTPTLLKQDGAP